MAWVRFIAPYDFKPKPAVTIAYAAGYVGNVTRACADAAIASGKAVKAGRPAHGVRKDAHQVGIPEARNGR